MKLLKVLPKTTKFSSYGIALIVGGFSVYVLSAWSIDHIINNTSIDETGWIIFGASVLRLITVGIVLFALNSYFNSEPKNTSLITFSLCACGGAQLIYPLAELLVKLLVLLGFLDSTGMGISNMGLEGWFNHGAVWLIFGIPGILFFIIAKDYLHNFRVQRGYFISGSIVGILMLFLIGLFIG